MADSWTEVPDLHAACESCRTGQLVKLGRTMPLFAALAAKLLRLARRRNRTKCFHGRVAKSSPGLDRGPRCTDLGGLADNPSTTPDNPSTTPDMSSTTPSWRWVPDVEVVVMKLQEVYISDGHGSLGVVDSSCSYISTRPFGITRCNGSSALVRNSGRDRAAKRPCQWGCKVHELCTRGHTQGEQLE